LRSIAKADSGWFTVFLDSRSKRAELTPFLTMRRSMGNPSCASAMVCRSLLSNFDPDQDYF